MTSDDPGEAAAEVTRLVESHRFTEPGESALQAAIARLLREAGIPSEREHGLGPGCRVDFFLPAPGLAVEVKVAGSPSGVVRQLLRYAERESVRAIVLVTTRRSMAAKMPRTLLGKPLACALAQAGLA